MLRIIANLLDVARLEAGKMELRRVPVRLADVVDSVLGPRALLARSRGIDVQTALDRRLWVHVDADLVTRLVENVLDNSFRYTPRGGRIDVSVTDPGGKAQLQIGNTGPPIPAEARRFIFEKFGQSSELTGRMNLGLGLYFCRLAAEVHGGRITIEEGPLPTVFQVVFPLARTD